MNEQNCVGKEKRKRKKKKKRRGGGGGQQITQCIIIINHGPQRLSVMTGCALSQPRLLTRSGQGHTTRSIMCDYPGAYGDNERPHTSLIICNFVPNMSGGHLVPEDIKLHIITVFGSWRRNRKDGARVMGPLDSPHCFRNRFCKRALHCMAPLAYWFCQRARHWSLYLTGFVGECVIGHSTSLVL